jgi:hypothetical protein
MFIPRLNKIERGVDNMKREQLTPIANIFETALCLLELLWRSDQIVQLAKDCNTFLQVNYVAYNRSYDRKPTN